MGILMMLILPIYEHGTFFHLFVWLSRTFLTLPYDFHPKTGFPAIPNILLFITWEL